MRGDVDRTARPVAARHRGDELVAQRRRAVRPAEVARGQGDVAHRVAQLEEVAGAREGAVVHVRLPARVLEAQPGQHAVAAAHRVLHRDPQLVVAAAERRLQARALVAAVRRRHLRLPGARRFQRAEVDGAADAAGKDAARVGADAGGKIGRDGLQRARTAADERDAARARERLRRVGAAQRDRQRAELLVLADGDPGDLVERVGEVLRDAAHGVALVDVHARLRHRRTRLHAADLLEVAARARRRRRGRRGALGQDALQRDLDDLPAAGQRLDVVDVGARVPGEHDAQAVQAGLDVGEAQRAVARRERRRGERAADVHACVGERLARGVGDAHLDLGRRGLRAHRARHGAREQHEEERDEGEPRAHRRPVRPGGWKASRQPCATGRCAARPPRSGARARRRW
jgi:hypothetical protein